MSKLDDELLVGRVLSREPAIELHAIVPAPQIGLECGLNVLRHLPRLLLLYRRRIRHASRALRHLAMPMADANCCNGLPFTVT